MKALARKSFKAAILATMMLGASVLAKPGGGGGGPAEPPVCSIINDLLNVPVLSCTGFVEHNLVNAGHAAEAATLLSPLMSSPSGIAIAEASVSGMTLSFTQALYGYTVIGLHIGGGSDHDGHVKESTAFYAFDAGTTGIDTIETRFDTLSNGGLYLTSPVPEPATYGMLLAGAGLLGVALRRRVS